MLFVPKCHIGHFQHKFLSGNQDLELVRQSAQSFQSPVLSLQYMYKKSWTL